MEKVNRPEFLSWGNSKLEAKHPFNKSMTRDTHTTKHPPRSNSRQLNTNSAKN